MQPDTKTWAAVALISKITTTIDGGYAVTLTFTEQDLEVIKELMAIKKDWLSVAVAFQRVNEQPKAFNPISNL